MRQTINFDCHRIRQTKMGQKRNFDYLRTWQNTMRHKRNLDCHRIWQNKTGQKKKGSLSLDMGKYNETKKKF